MLWKLLGKLWLALLSLRYTIEVKGLENLTPERLARKGGILFLPNHTAHIEPLLLFIYLWPKYRMRPIVIEYIYRTKLLKPIMRLVRALPIPNFDTSINPLKVRRAERSIAEVAEGLKAGDHFMIYPSGRLKSSGREVLGGASGTHSLLQECPDTNVVLIRTTGLWGSMFSRAIEGKTPDLTKTLWSGIRTIFRNLIFFSPRRKILIEVEPAPDDFPRNASRVDFNRYLENWYNQYPDDHGGRLPEEPLCLVSYSRWRKEFKTPFQAKNRKEGSQVAVSDELREKVYGEIRTILSNPNLEIQEEMNLATDLGMDSLNIAELIAFLSKKYDIEEVHPEDFDTVRSALEIAAGSQSSSQPRHAIIHAGWPEEETRPDPVPPMGKTIPAAFLNSCERMGPFAACGDDLVGVVSYKKLKRNALVLALHFRTMKEEKIGVLLPSSMGAYLTILALQLAGKVPVMLNWTLGPRYLDEMMRLSGAETAISSWRFLDRLSHVEFGKLTDQLILLEDIREKLSLSEKLRGAFLSLRHAKTILRVLGLSQADENAPAVILFTSGTEASPKGVPLSHKNIISNLRSGSHCIELAADDVVYGILPPFHSFGFSVAGLFSIMAGMRIAFYPDPTDSFALAEGIERWKVTIFCSAPSFLRGLFQAAKSKQLASLRLFITGAEKTPQELYDKVKALGAKIIEGYGITECSPILTLNRPNLPPKGVGHPLPDVEMIMIHPETLEPVPVGQEGEICVRGPNVFHGYLGNPRSSPFIEIHGKKWYRTGDLGRLEEGALILSGRLKRFTKIGGEMISLGAIEEALAAELSRQNKITNDVPSLALISDERDPAKSQLVLFSIADVDREAVNELLNQAGFSRLVKISQVRKVEEIPLMGTGKTDYRRLQSMLDS